jgi:hypothetical protein
MGRPKKDSTAGILMEINKEHPITEKFILSEAREMYTKLHSDPALLFPETLMENKFYTYEDFMSWIRKFSENDKKIRQIGKKIQELLRGRIKKAVTSDRVNPAFIKFLLSTEFGYSEKTITEVQHKVDSELSDEKQALLDALKGVVPDATNESVS